MPQAFRASDEEPQDPTRTDEKRIDSAIDVLMEHFDTVQVFVTRYDGGEPNDTTGLSKGRGNYYARRHFVDCWVQNQRRSDGGTQE